MKELVGLISQAKYQTKEFIPNSIHGCTDEQLEIINSALHSINASLDELDYYIHNKLALVLETAPIVQQISLLRDKLIETGTDPATLEMSETDLNKIINTFTKQLETPHNTEYLLQILMYAIKLWMYEQQQTTHGMA